MTRALICDKINISGSERRHIRGYPVYRKVKAQDGFMQIFERHPGVVETVEDDTYMVRYRELFIPAKLADTVTEKSLAGSYVQFAWNHKGVSTITKVFRNLLEI